MVRDCYAGLDFNRIISLLQYYCFGKRDEFIVDSFMSLRGRGTVNLSDYYRRDLEVQSLYFLLCDIHELPNFSESALYRIENDVLGLRAARLSVIHSSIVDDDNDDEQLDPTSIDEN